jgi:FAD/FMN-containing dehydrogenase/Fe-S oxidoreductase
MDQFDQQRQRIVDDLRGLVAGDVLGDDLFIQLYASDASIYEVRPAAVVRPRSAADVVALVQYAADKRIPVHARGAGTGASGESLGPGLVVDFSRYMRRAVRVDAESVRVQPGMVLERLNAQLRQQGRVFGPDTAAAAVNTVGGMIAVDPAGRRWLKYGSPHARVRSLQVVLADGRLLEVGREPLAVPEGFKANPRKRELVERLAFLLSRHAETICRHRPRSAIGRYGYRLDGVLGDDQLDLPRLLSGSEGTLALITEATLSTAPVARHRAVALLLFDSLEKAARTALDLLPRQPTACELMDRRHVSLAREDEVRFDVLIPQQTEAVLLVEREGDDAAEARRWLQEVVDQSCRGKREAFASRQAFDPDEAALFWQLAARSRPALDQIKGASRPVPAVEDVAVPPELLPEFLVRVQNALKRSLVTASLLAHAGQGQIHVQPFLDLDAAADVDRMRRLAETLYEEVFQVGGTIVGEHAYGLRRTAFVARQAGPLCDVFREVKGVFDPDNLLNPGKLVGDDAELMTRDIRPALRPAAAERGQTPQSAPAGQQEGEGLRDLVELQLDWRPERVLGVVKDCNRCGQCRTQEPALRMCPILRFSPREESSPRAKANLIRGILAGRIDLKRVTSDEFKEIADLCVHCHMCRLECPARVDVPRLMAEAKGAYVAANGLRLPEWAITHLDAVGSLGGLMRPAANWALGNRVMRWLLEKTFGIAQGRKLPRFARHSFASRATRRRLNRPSRHPGRKVAYFVDVYANHFDPQLAEAAVAVLERNGVAVYVPPEQRQAGMPAIACGSLEHARALARHNVGVLAEAVRQGYHVVATEPAAALCLTREYPQLIDDEDARLVADSTSEVCSYLWKMHTTGHLQLDLRPIRLTLGYHLPCHLRALGVGSPGENLLRLIPGIRVVDFDAGCSGMSGTYGLLRKHYRSSLRAGWRLITSLRDPAIQAGTTECSTCKMQMEQGTTKPTIHPIKLLALAYGLMPEWEDLAAAVGQELAHT